MKREEKRAGGLGVMCVSCFYCVCFGGWWTKKKAQFNIIIYNFDCWFINSQISQEWGLRHIGLRYQAKIRAIMQLLSLQLCWAIKCQILKYCESLLAVPVWVRFSFHGQIIKLTIHMVRRPIITWSCNIKDTGTNIILAIY